MEQYPSKKDNREQYILRDNIYLDYARELKSVDKDNA